jgi:hypothetical protein
MRVLMFQDFQLLDVLLQPFSCPKDPEKQSHDFVTFNNCLLSPEMLLLQPPLPKMYNFQISM